MTPHPSHSQQPGRRSLVHRLHTSERMGLAWIWLVFGVCLLAPALGVGVRAVGGIAEAGLGEMAMTPARWGSLGRSVFYASLIATFATLLAWPVAVIAARARRSVWLLVLAAPMLLPSYLTYAGWSIARSPTTPIGRWVSLAPERGFDWLPMMVGRGVAVWGLSLWAWPLAAVVMAVGLRAVGTSIAESLRLEPCNLWQRWQVLARASLPSIAAAWGLVALLMLGSAVPMHVARIETYAIRVWMTLDAHPGEAWRAWLTAWPLVVVAAGAGWVIAGRLARAGQNLAHLNTDEAPRHRTHPVGLLLAALPWVVAVIVPLGLFWWSMGSPRALLRLFERAGTGLATSSLIGLIVGLLAISLCLASAQAASARRGGSGGLRFLLGCFLAWALLPGVLAGAAIAQMLRLPGVPDALAETGLPMVLAHLSRVAFLPVLVGLWLGASEAGAIAETRLLDGATGFVNWARTSLRLVLGPAAAVGVASGCLSFHEIESSVQVQGPGIDHMAQRLLQWLHYERMAELSAAGVLLLGVGLGASVLVVAGGAFGRKG